MRLSTADLSSEFTVRHIGDATCTRKIATPCPDCHAAVSWPLRAGSQTCRTREGCRRQPPAPDKLTQRQSPKKWEAALSNAITEYRYVQSNKPRLLRQIEQVPEVKREAKYYLENITKIKSIDEFIGNHRVFSFAMTAFGLEDMTYAKAYMRKALTEGVDSRTSFANKLVDSRFREFVSAFNFARHGAVTTVFDRAQQGTVDKYVEQKLEGSVRSRSEGAALAMYFERRLPEIKNAYGILADRALLALTQTALGLPASSSVLNIDRQAQEIERKLDIKSLSDPGKLRVFLERFTARWEMANPSQSTPALNAFDPGTSARGLAPDVLSALQNLNKR